MPILARTGNAKEENAQPVNLLGPAVDGNTTTPGAEQRDGVVLVTPAPGGSKPVTATDPLPVSMVSGGLSETSSPFVLSPNADGNINILPAVAGQVLTGYAVTEKAGAAATITVRHGLLIGAPEIFTINLAKSESERIKLPNVQAQAGIFLERVLGNVDITLFYKVI